MEGWPRFFFSRHSHVVDLPCTPWRTQGRVIDLNECESRGANLKRALLLPLLAAGVGLSPRPGGQSPSPTEAAVDSARAEVAVGRYWHATKILVRIAEEGPLRPSELLLLAEAESGWGNWSATLAILDGAGWLDDVDDGRGRLLRARALEEAGRWGEAADAYAAYLDLGRGARSAAVRLRRVQALDRASREGAMPELRALAGGQPVAASWIALRMARRASEGGDPDRVRAMIAVISDPAALSRAWNLEARSYLAAGDTTATVEKYRGMLPDLSSGRRAFALQTVAELLLATTDSVGALAAADSSFALRSTGGSAGRAARMILATGDPGAADALALSVALDAAGDAPRALRAIQMHIDGWDADSTRSQDVLLDRARLLSAAGRHDDAIRELRSLAESAHGDFELKLLKQWRTVRRTQGRRDAVRAIDNWIVERFPESPEAVSVIFFRGDQLHDRGDLAAAAGQYRRAANMAPEVDRAGLSRMRLGQIHLQRREFEDAADVYEEYLETLPEGRRWDQAAYWAARAALGLNDEVRARTHLDRLRARFPLSYYSALAADLDGKPFKMDFPEGSAPTAPSWLAGELVKLDLLRDVGLDEAAAAAVDRLMERADESLDAKFALAEAFIARGLTAEGVGLGWEIRAQGGPLNLRLLRVTYPFPYREIVEWEAAERGVDPILLAALIRQESGFSAVIRSSAGAIGLMQVMPETGRELARAEGFRDFTTSSLELPEINVHLGARFWIDMSRRFGDNVPLVLAAYNAGPSRARRWRDFPEIVDPSRFTERIPFTETRGYVKSIQRLLALYRVLYGDDIGS
ncbi:MAG: transglycosylase SLT domain-containing protein [Gemmatimonadota bacterium]|nr:MAG: transglycosylase SLT domain-containing protein [Gemmatimonadota bacterium]